MDFEQAQDRGRHHDRVENEKSADFWCVFMTSIVLCVLEGLHKDCRLHGINGLSSNPEVAVG